MLQDYRDINCLIKKNQQVIVFSYANRLYINLTISYYNYLQDYYHFLCYVMLFLVKNNKLTFTFWIFYLNLETYPFILF
jgi:hypothetical protein